MYKILTFLCIAGFFYSVIEMAAYRKGLLKRDISEREKEIRVKSFFDV